MKTMPMHARNALFNDNVPNLIAAAIFEESDPNDIPARVLILKQEFECIMRLQATVSYDFLGNTFPKWR